MKISKEWRALKANLQRIKLACQKHKHVMRNRKGEKWGFDVVTLDGRSAFRTFCGQCGADAYGDSTGAVIKTSVATRMDCINVTNS
jgi:hypothetical protein